MEKGMGAAFPQRPPKSLLTPAIWSRASSI